MNGAKCLNIREQDPLKQGLKQGYEKMYGVEFVIREQDPLKQGLKLDCPNSPMSIIVIREQDPLKQGLKLGNQDSRQISQNYS